MTSTISSSTANSSSTTNPVSVASSSSAGAAGGSVINVSSLVSQLVAAEQAPQQSIITSQTTAVTANISALGTLKGALSTFQSALASLDSSSVFNAETATSSNSAVLTASAASSAVSGTYKITVSDLASAQQLLSTPFPGGSDAAVGTGGLTLSLGGSSFNVTLTSSNDTLEGIASAINAASDNPGISATVINGSDGAHLVLSSTQTGAANAITVTASGALSALAYGGGDTANYTEESTPADANFSIAGVAYTSASNTVTDALDGVTLNLAGTTPDGASASLTVANDTSTVQSNISNFVSAYNALQSTLASLGSYDASSGTGGQFMGNPVLTDTQNQVQQALYSLVGSSTYNTLASIGITTNSDGSLSLNSTTLQTALSSNFAAVSQLFSSTTGVATQLNTQIDADLASGGTIESYSHTLTQQENALTAQSNNLTTQTNALTASLTQQYSALNALLSSLQTTSSYLSQAFNSLPTVQGTPNA
ncbi:MAG: flagellar filament capping protein FliD [Steroidobacteraceae bacterium]